MGTARRRLAVLVSALLVALLPSAAVAQQDGGFGTTPQIVEPEPPGIVVTDVTVASLDGFDRVTFAIDGGRAGWRVEYTDNPVTQGQGAPVDVAGDATLRVVLNAALIPPDAPEGSEPFLDDVAGPAGGVVTEIRNNSIFEGDHEFFIGVTEQVPFRVLRLDDPQRVVIDLVNDAPVGGVATGAGGTAPTGWPLPATALAAALAVAAGSGVVARRRRA